VLAGRDILEEFQVVELPVGGTPITVEINLAQVVRRVKVGENVIARILKQVGIVDIRDHNPSESCLQLAK
jgi:hypothetical protein